MSTMTVSAGWETPSLGSVRLTRRGRITVVLIGLVVALGVMFAASGWATATLEAGTPEPVRIVEVAPGDTLYGIAGEIAEPGKIREMVYHLRELNSLPNSSLQIGQKIAVPVVK